MTSTILNDHNNCVITVITDITMRNGHMDVLGDHHSRTVRHSSILWLKAQQQLCKGTMWVHLPLTEPRLFAPSASSHTVVNWGSGAPTRTSVLYSHTEAKVFPSQRTWWRRSAAGAPGSPSPSRCGPPVAGWSCGWFSSSSASAQQTAED